MAELLGVNIEEEFVLYCAAVGKRPEPAVAQYDE
jgi:hypothetical protein